MSARLHNLMAEVPVRPYAITVPAGPPAARVLSIREYPMRNGRRYWRVILDDRGQRVFLDVEACTVSQAIGRARHQLELVMT